jgi:AcrR family transcriptional regulator
LSTPLFGASAPTGFRSSSVADIARVADVSGTLAYACFVNKEDRFLAALDQNVAKLIEEGVSSILETAGDQTWRDTLIFSLVSALDHHPLAHRVLAALEPNATGRMIELPALNNLRLAMADRLRNERDLERVTDHSRAALGRGGPLRRGGIMRCPLGIRSSHSAPEAERGDGVLSPRFRAGFELGGSSIATPMRTRVWPAQRNARTRLKPLASGCPIARHSNWEEQC